MSRSVPIGLNRLLLPNPYVETEHASSGGSMESAVQTILRCWATWFAELFNVDSAVDTGIFQSRITSPGLGQ
ncbi:hypothetical protein ALP20_00353 [Pseudomonas coronafaciens pv. coronafaciens]|nr:hypothetical protein ALP20_00353 [Pseudomonas coronafaciens pv. coronafaciens]